MVCEKFKNIGKGGKLDVWEQVSLIHVPGYHCTGHDIYMNSLMLNINTSYNGKRLTMTLQWVFIRRTVQNTFIYEYMYKIYV